MNVEEYKNAISGKDVLDHTTLNITLKEVAAAKNLPLASELDRILRNNKIQKPEGFPVKIYDQSPEYYRVDLSPEQIDTIIDMYLNLEAGFVTEKGETTPTASFYAGLADRWGTL